ncbi:MAG TPA: ester cyclase [Ktedonobacteraceae bacterium]|nr:ester cyclase [Ktedonobacteraceae bacterium]
MSSETNKAIAHRWYEEVFNTGNLALISELFAPNFVDHDPSNPLPGLEGVGQLVSMYRGAFPNLHLTIEDELSEGEKLVTRFVARGTHNGPLMGIPPTGKQTVVTGIDILRFENGKIVEHWGNQDLLGMMQQIGAIPAPAQAG